MRPTTGNYQDHLHDGFIYVTVLPENVMGADPTVDDLNLWADEYAILVNPPTDANVTRMVEMLTE